MHILQIEGRTTSSQIGTARRIWLYFAVGGGIVVLDQATKLIAFRLLSSGQVVRVFGNDFLWLTLVFNPGSAFGMRAVPPLLLTIIAFAAAVGLAIYLIRHPLITLFQGLPLCLIMAGATGNLIDRLRIGQVVDFISVDMPNWIMDRWPVFNVADSALSVGICSLILLSIFEARNTGSGAFEAE